MDLVKTPAQIQAENAAAQQQKAREDAAQKAREDAAKRIAEENKAKEDALRKGTATASTERKLSVTEQLNAKIKDQQITVAEDAVKAAAISPSADVNITSVGQQTASPFMPGAPTATVASAGLAPTASGLQPLPPVTHADDLPKTGPEAAIADAAASRRAEATGEAPTKPTALSSSHVLFYSSRPNLGASGPNGIIRFKDHYAQTDNEADIKYLDENKAHFGIRRA